MAARVWLPIFAIPVSLACAVDPAAESADEFAEAETSATDSDDSTNDGVTTGEGESVPEFGQTFTVIGTVANGLSAVRDLEFNPGALDQLWTYNTAIHGVVIFFNPGTPQQTHEVRIDPYGQHFMAYVSAAAFGDNGNFASCQESRDEWNGGPQAPDDFMGPTLWSSDLDIFGLPNAGEGSHLDMLHQSPLCMGIAHDVQNVYWTFDGLHGNIVRYDFQVDHGPGNSDHSDGIITRYSDVSVTRVMNIPGHMELDHATGMLYVADTGANRIMRLDTTSGTNTGTIPGDWDGAVYTAVEGADFQVLVEDVDQPSGLALDDGRLFVSEFGTGDIIAFDLDGTEIGRLSTPSNVMGITIGPAGDLWYVDPVANEVVRVED
jgi:hypothetical protein